MCVCVCIDDVCLLDDDVLCCFRFDLLCVITVFRLKISQNFLAPPPTYTFSVCVL